VLNFRRQPKTAAAGATGEWSRMIWMILVPGLAIVLLAYLVDPHKSGTLGRIAEVAGFSTDQNKVDTRLSVPADSSGGASFTVPPLSEEPESPAPVPQKTYFRGVKAAYLASIRDDEPFRASEADAWFNLLDVLEKARPADLKQASRRPVAFAQLFRQSAEYRGEVVTVRGRMVRAFRLYAPKNEYGFTQYYQTWIQPADNLANPMVIYVLHLPEGFPTGMHISEEVEITGFFFKRWAYRASDTIRSAPVVLAKEVRWYKASEAVAPRPPTRFDLLLAIGGGLALVFLAGFYLYRRTQAGDSGTAPFRVGKKAEESPAEVAESLKRLAESQGPPPA